MATARKTYRTRCFVAAATVILAWPALALAQPASLAVHKLTPAGQSWSDLVLDANHEAVSSPDGKWVVYWFDGETDNVPDLYIASRFGGDVRRLSVPRPTGSVAIDSLFFRVSADSRSVVFLLDQETPGRLELWSVPVAGGPADAMKLSAPILPAAYVPGFRLDGDFAVFSVYNDPGGFELWSAPIDGSAPAEPLHGPLPAGASGGFSVEFANGRTLFRSDLATAGRQELWSVPTDGSAPPVRLNGDLVAGGAVLGYSLSPTGQRVVYRADQRFDGVEELWSVPIAGPSTLAVRLSPDLQAFADVRSSWRYSSDGSRVLFRVDSGSDEQLELWSVPIAGPAASAVHLNIGLVAGGNVSSFASLGDHVTYVADNAVDEQHQAFIVPIAGPFSASLRLHGDLPAGGDVGGVDIFPTAPEPTVLLGGDLRVNDQLELFTQHLDGVGTPYPMLGDLDPGMAYHTECGSGVLADFSAAFLCGDFSTVGKVELWRVEVDFSSNPDRLSSPVAIAAADVTSVQVSPNGQWAAFRSDATLDERFDLWRVPTDGSTFPARVHATPASGLFDVVDQAIWWTPESAGIVYAADHEVNGKTDLWISDGMVFRADFEWGDVAEWSTVAP